MHDEVGVTPAARTVAMCMAFYPRGGSAQVARYLVRALEAGGHWHPRLATGSLGDPGDHGHAGTFYAGIDLAPASYDDAVERWTSGSDPMDAPFPMHASFEPREGVPDRVVTSLHPAQGEHAADAWATHLRTHATLIDADVAHVHHLTPLHEAVRVVAPDLPIVTHLHGTELKLLEAIDRGALAGADGLHGGWWRERMGAWARASSRIVVVSPADRTRAIDLLDLDETLVQQVPNGVDIARFTPRDLSQDERLAHWHEWLVADPQGWMESDPSPGSISYTASDLHAFADSPVLLYVGRFLGFKRVPLLIRAYARARSEHGVRAPLVIWGGAPGEFEGEHPHSVAQQLGAEGVFFAGWRGHDDLPLGLGCADVLVAPSTDEPFGQVYLEAMACGLPVIGTQSGGPPSFVNVERDALDGWLVPPDDEAALARAIADSVLHEDVRRARGANGLAHARSGYAWGRLAKRFGAIYDAAADSGPLPLPRT